MSFRLNSMEWLQNGVTDPMAYPTCRCRQPTSSKQPWVPSGVVARADGAVLAWGQYFISGVPVVPPRATNAIAVAAGFSHDVALRSDGTVVGWGANSQRGIVPAEATNITAVAYSAFDTFALRSDGQVIAWNDTGQSFPMPWTWTNVAAIAGTTPGSLALVASEGPPCSPAHWLCHRLWVPLPGCVRSRSVPPQ